MNYVLHISHHQQDIKYQWDFPHQLVWGQIKGRAACTHCPDNNYLMIYSEELLKIPTEALLWPA